MVFCYVLAAKNIRSALFAHLVCVCMCAYACLFELVMMILDELAKQKQYEKYKTDTCIWFMYNNWFTYFA